MDSKMLILWQICVLAWVLPHPGSAFVASNTTIPVASKTAIPVRLLPAIHVRPLPVIHVRPRPVARPQLIYRCTRTVADVVFVLDNSGSVGKGNFHGKSSNSRLTKKAARSLKRRGVRMFSVAIGHKVRRSELRAIASYPKYKHMFTVGNFNALKTITRGITKNICQVARPQLIYRCKHAVADVVFVLDNSGSVGKGNFLARPRLIYRCTRTVADVVFVLDNSGSVGKGNFLRRSELRAIASYPKYKHMFTVSNFNALKTITRGITKNICQVAPYPIPNLIPLPNIYFCKNAVADVVFVLDTSGSVGIVNFRKVHQFVIGIINSWKIGRNKVRVAVISFSNYAFVNIYPNQFSNKYYLIRAIKKIKYRSGGTNTYNALRLLGILFQRRYGDRKYAPNIAIVVTDGKSSNSILTKLEADKIKKKGVEMFIVPVGRRVCRSEVRAMASYPEYKHIISVGKFNALRKITWRITKNICQGIQTNSIGAGIQTNSIGAVMKMFIRVQVAFIGQKPIKIITSKSPIECARYCLRIKQCKSFNFDMESAATNTTIDVSERPHRVSKLQKLPENLCKLISNKI
ncbi:COL6A [Acanthosepion pharaonis]|uniref:COL6A n=1 Tax=Acanthosepion pharaonis TaxID=158019 RepID=A0A812BEY8_ACAPH|nr:COL6A [Sepia pharaonis]